MAARRVRRDPPAEADMMVLPGPMPIGPGDEALPSEEDIKAAEQERANRLDAMALTLSAERAEAIQAKETSGITIDWAEDEEFYDGIDDANRDEHSNAWRTRPAGQILRRKKGEGQSAIFMNMTRPFVNAAAAKMSMLLTPRFSLKPTPVPELISTSKGEIPEQMLNQIGIQFAGQPQQAADAGERAVRQAMQIVEESKQKAEKAQKRIEDWHVESGYYAQNRLMIKDAAKIGTGVLKGPIPEKRRKIALVNGQLVINEEIKPVTYRIDPWNLFPDPACGENIHHGGFIWEKEPITAKELRKLKGGDYLDNQIDAVLAEGPMRAVAPTKKNDSHLTPGKGPYEIWYRYGDLTRENVEAAGCECEEGEDVFVPALVTMVNDHVIKVALNHLDSGEFPYDVFAWPQKRKGMPWGCGIARAGRSPQRVFAAAWRAMLDNAARAAGPQVITGTQVSPSNGINEIVPWKRWDYAEDGDIDDVRKAFAFIEVPMRQQELAAIIMMAMREMEQSTNMPMLLQGQQGNAPDLVGVVEILNANASEFLRDLGSSYDDDVSEPHGKRYYDWLLQHGEDDEKGEFVLDARGASVNVERMLQDQELLKAMQMSLNPVFKKDPVKFMDEYLRSRHFEPKRFDYDDEQWQQIVANMAKGPQDQRLAVAQLRADVDQKLLAMEQQFEAQENEKDRQAKIAVEMIDERIASAELDSVERQVLEKLKKDLAETSLKLGVQRELSEKSIAHDKDLALAGHVVDLKKAATPKVTSPPTEPAGRAHTGRAFQQ